MRRAVPGKKAGDDSADHGTAELTANYWRSFTMRAFLIGRVSRLAACARSTEMLAAGQQTMTKMLGSALGGIATAGVYAVLGALLATGILALSVAGTAVLAIRSAAGSLQQLMFPVNQCYEEPLKAFRNRPYRTEAPVRLLPTVRLSLENDESTSPGRQMGRMQQYAQLNNHVLIPIGPEHYDLGVSGSLRRYLQVAQRDWRTIAPRCHQEAQWPADEEHAVDVGNRPDRAQWAGPLGRCRVSKG